MSSALVINDNKLSLFIIERVAIRAGITDILTAIDGREALSVYQNLERCNPPVSHPKLVFLDLHMPVMDGWEFLDRFVYTYLPLFTDTKVVITTSSIDPADSERAKEYSCVIDFKSTNLTVEYIQKLL